MHCDGSSATLPRTYTSNTTSLHAATLLSAGWFTVMRVDNEFMHCFSISSSIHTVSNNLCVCNAALQASGMLRRHLRWARSKLRMAHPWSASSILDCMSHALLSITRPNVCSHSCVLVSTSWHHITSRHLCLFVNALRRMDESYGLARIADLPEIHFESVARTNPLNTKEDD